MGPLQGPVKLPYGPCAHMPQTLQQALTQGCGNYSSVLVVFALWLGSVSSPRLAATPKRQRIGMPTHLCQGISQLGLQGCRGGCSLLGHESCHCVVKPLHCCCSGKQTRTATPLWSILTERRRINICNRHRNRDAVADRNSGSMRRCFK
jgi:hypothetical protein